MEILFIHTEICRLALGILCLSWDIFMFYSLYFMSEHHANVSGHTIFTTTNNIVAPSSLVLKVYIDLKYLNLCLSSVVKKFLIHKPSILDLRLCLEMIYWFSISYAADT